MEYLSDTYIDFYAGIWGSNVSGGTNSLSGNELDYYGGFSGASAPRRLYVMGWRHSLL